MKCDNDLNCYFVYMYNYFNEKECRLAFGDDGCGWEYLWQKWVDTVNQRGRDAAIASYYVEMLDASKQDALRNRAFERCRGF